MHALSTLVNERLQRIAVRVERHLSAEADAAEALHTQLVELRSKLEGSSEETQRLRALLATAGITGAR